MTVIMTLVLGYGYSSRHNFAPEERFDLHVGIVKLHRLINCTPEAT